MCGVFGFVAKAGQTVDPSLVKAIAAKTEQRGPHAFGFAWIDAQGRLRMFKQEGRITRSLDLLNMTAGARMLIGHTRFATQGRPEDNLNNHPHPVDGGWQVHNGVIRRYQAIVDEHQLRPVSHCDSEVLGLLIEQAQGSLVQRCAEAVRIAQDSPLVMLALWRSPQRLVAVRAGNPLFVGEDKRGHYLGSFADHLPEAAAVLNESVLSFSIDGSHVKRAEHPLNLPELAVAPVKRKAGSVERKAPGEKRKTSPAKRKLATTTEFPPHWRKYSWFHE